MKRPLIISGVLAALIAVVFFIPGGDELLEKRALTSTLTASVYWRYSTILERFMKGSGGLVYETRIADYKKVVLIGAWLDWKGNTKLEWRQVGPDKWEIADVYYGSLVEVKADGAITLLK